MKTLSFENRRVFAAFTRSCANQRIHAERSVCRNDLRAAQDQAKAVLAQGMEMGLSPYPALAALPDYFANPNDRTLSITLTPKPPLTLTALAAIASSPTAAMTLMSPDNLKVTVQ
ncbi:hypothetical protein [Gluconobacter cerinus]|uniref:hypothetical protein n=1 Tax=Gluconobacter cerinus TaxID=38307 RepID=UPI001B8B8FB7|nr:hypothetical protein [Gluconobacter cerinus]MBS1042570.1 hypothetical protein [Gluconobacter cerinus]